MTVTEDTPARLVLRGSPGVPAVAALGAAAICFVLAVALWPQSGLVGASLCIFALAFLGVLIAFAEWTTATFDRPAGLVTLHRRSLRGRQDETIPLSDILESRVETALMDSKSGSRIVSRAILATRSGPVPLRKIKMSGDGAKNTAATVNRWLASG